MVSYAVEVWRQPEVIHGESAQSIASSNPARDAAHFQGAPNMPRLTRFEESATGTRISPSRRPTMASC